MSAEERSAPGSPAQLRDHACTISYFQADTASKWRPHPLETFAGDNYCYFNAIVYLMLQYRESMASLATALFSFRSRKAQRANTVVLDDGTNSDNDGEVATDSCVKSSGVSACAAVAGRALEEDAVLGQWVGVMVSYYALYAPATGGTDDGARKDVPTVPMGKLRNSVSQLSDTKYGKGVMNDAAEFYEYFLSLLIQGARGIGAVADGSGDISVCASGRKRLRDISVGGPLGAPPSPGATGGNAATTALGLDVTYAMAEEWCCSNGSCDDRRVPKATLRSDALFRVQVYSLATLATDPFQYRSFGSFIGGVASFASMRESRACPRCGEAVTVSSTLQALPRRFATIQLSWHKVPDVAALRHLLLEVLEDAIDGQEAFGPAANESEAFDNGSPTSPRRRGRVVPNAAREPVTANAVRRAERMAPSQKLDARRARIDLDGGSIFDDADADCDDCVTVGNNLMPMERPYVDEPDTLRPATPSPSAKPFGHLTAIVCFRSRHYVCLVRALGGDWYVCEDGRQPLCLGSAWASVVSWLMFKRMAPLLLTYAMDQHEEGVPQWISPSPRPSCTEVDKLVRALTMGSVKVVDVDASPTLTAPSWLSRFGSAVGLNRPLPDARSPGSNQQTASAGLRQTTITSFVSGSSAVKGGSALPVGPLCSAEGTAVAAESSVADSVTNIMSALGLEAASDAQRVREMLAFTGGRANECVHHLLAGDDVASLRAKAAARLSAHRPPPALPTGGRTSQEDVYYNISQRGPRPSGADPPLLNVPLSDPPCAPLAQRSQSSRVLAGLLATGRHLEGLPVVPVVDGGGRSHWGWSQGNDSRMDPAAQLPQGLLAGNGGRASRGSGPVPTAVGGVEGYVTRAIGKSETPQSLLGLQFFFYQCTCAAEGKVIVKDYGGTLGGQVSVRTDYAGVRLVMNHSKALALLSSLVIGPRGGGDGPSSDRLTSKPPQQPDAQWGNLFAILRGLSPLHAYEEAALGALHDGGGARLGLMDAHRLSPDLFHGLRAAAQKNTHEAARRLALCRAEGLPTSRGLSGSSSSPVARPLVSSPADCVTSPVMVSSGVAGGAMRGGASNGSSVPCAMSDEGGARKCVGGEVWQVDVPSGRKGVLGFFAGTVNAVKKLVGASPPAKAGAPNSTARDIYEELL